MTIKKLCEKYNIEYNSHNPTYSLAKLKSNYLVDTNGKKDYTVIRELNAKEKFSVATYGKNKKLLEPLIYSILYQSEENKIMANMKDFFIMFGFANKNFIKFSKKTVSNQYNIDEAILNDFVYEVDPMLRTIIKNILADMERNALIEVVKHRTVSIQYIENGNIYTQFRMATDEERENILKSVTDLVKEHGYKKMDDVPYSLKNDLYLEVCKKLGFSYIYWTYEIILNKSGIKNYIVDVLDFKSQMNKNIESKILKSVQGNLKHYEKETKNKCIEAVIRI